MRVRVKRQPLAVSRLRIQNFKAIRDSGIITFSPLTAFIGNNGVGKSSLVEGLETLRDIVQDGLDEAMQRWHGFEFVWNRAVRHNFIPAQRDKRDSYENPMRFDIWGHNDEKQRYSATTQINAEGGMNNIYIESERCVNAPLIGVSRNAFGEVKGLKENYFEIRDGEHVLHDGESLLKQSLDPETSLWQFVRLNPESMIDPKPLRRVAGRLPLATNGSNIAQYLLDLRSQDSTVVDGIVETMQVVLPYSQDFQPVITSEMGRNVYLQLREQGMKDALPAWLFSTGTLRVVALLALLRHPEPPPLIVIEEIENGLDPRTIHLLIEEMRYAVESGTTQIILTTHSPYLLDLLTLSQIVVVERSESGEPNFYRPSDEESLRKWSDQFTPGQLYTMGRLGRGGK